jgi:mannose-6-phosphate isomerase-like protein (cupin superfamily)
VAIEGKGLVEGLLAQEVGKGDAVTIPPRAKQEIQNIGEGDIVFLAICTPRFVEESYVDAEGWKMLYYWAIRTR